MKRQDQQVFVDDLINNVRIELTDKLKAGVVPEEWDGHELRLWIAERFAESVFGMYQAKLTVKAERGVSAKRLKDYRNEVLVRNL